MKRLTLLILVVIFAATGWILRQSYATHVRTVSQTLASMTDQTTTSTTLNNLKNYVSSHAGTSTTVVLTADYNAAAQAAQEAAVTTPSASLYAQAQAACGGRGVNSVAQAECNQAYIQSHSVSSTTTVAPTAPNISDYTYHLVAPKLAFDAATIFFVLAAIALIMCLMPKRHDHHEHRAKHRNSYL